MVKEFAPFLVDKLYDRFQIDGNNDNFLFFDVWKYSDFKELRTYDRLVHDYKGIFLDEQKEPKIFNLAFDVFCGLNGFKISLFLRTGEFDLLNLELSDDLILNPKNLRYEKEFCLNQEEELFNLIDKIRVKMNNLYLDMKIPHQPISI